MRKKDTSKKTPSVGLGHWMAVKTVSEEEAVEEHQIGSEFGVGDSSDCVCGSCASEEGKWAEKVTVWSSEGRLRLETSTHKTSCRSHD